MIGILRKNALLAQFCLTITTKNSNLKTYPQAINIALRKTWMIVLKNFNEKNLNNIRNFICFLGKRPTNMLFSICLLLMSLIPNNWNRKHLLTSCFDNLINVLYFIPKKKYEKIHSTAFVISRKLKTSWQEVCYKSKKDDQMLKMVIIWKSGFSIQHCMEIFFAFVQSSAYLRFQKVQDKLKSTSWIFSKNLKIKNINV